MAHFCPDCKRTFENRIVNCPLCGYGIVNDSNPESYYIQSGYTRFDLPTLPQKNNTSSRPDVNPHQVHIQDEDILADLRNSYNEYVETISASNGTTVQPSDSNTTHSNNHPNTANNQPEDNDFFAGFTGQNFTSPNETPSGRTDSNYSADNSETGTHSRTNEYYTPSGTRPRHRNRRSLRFSFARRIPWRLIFILLAIIVLIVVVSIIWQMRYEILDSLTNLFISLLPVGIIIVGIIWMIRSIFK